MIDVEKTRDEAKKILESFAKALEKVKTEGVLSQKPEKSPDFLGVQRSATSLTEPKDIALRDEDRRSEGLGNSSLIDKEIMMKNAPKTNGDCIESEKGGWV